MKIGIIGLGDMGKMFARIWDEQSFEVYGCDLPDKFESLIDELKDTKIQILKDAVSVSRICDFIVYSVEAENIEAVVKYAGPSTKIGAIVTGQTSVKTPEIAAFEKYLPKDTQIVGSHALFGPSVNPKGQTMAIFNHRASQESFDIAFKLLGNLGSKIEILNDYHAHDKMMADIQVITHVGFESIGTAFMHRKSFPWENKEKINGIDNIKILLTLRIFSYKAHVYSGLAFHNPFAIKDVRKFATIENELFGLMITENYQKFKSKILKAKDIVFKDHDKKLMLDDDLMQEYTLNPGEDHKPNSHLSLLSMVCSWAELGINPYKNLVCQTPPFKLRVGLAEYLFLNEALLNETIETAIKDKSALIDDLAFHTAVHEWTNILELGDKKAYEQHFEATKRFLGSRLEEGRNKSNQLISRINN
jgi:prephenate dehydrogenase (NADP+)